MRKLLRGIAAAMAALLAAGGIACASADENAPGLEEFPDFASIKMRNPKPGKDLGYIHPK